MKTIAAISTAAAPGGIGVIRISGDEARAVGDRVFKSISGAKLCDMAGYTCRFGHVYAPDGERLDECVATVFAAPHSFTGEDVVELSCHGGLFVLKAVLQAVFAAGAVSAAPGEFTRRAFLNGKMDLAQAEAVMQIISAQGREAMKAAQAGHDGALSHRIEKLRSDLTDIGAHLAAWADYPDDDIPQVDETMLKTRLAAGKTALKDLLAGFDGGRILREGVVTVIAGRPNAGKSTLMNLLAGCERSIVTDLAGTTRDAIDTEVINDSGHFVFIDTAGLRRKSKVDDDIERYSVLRAQMAVERADVCVIMIDGVEGFTEQDSKVAGIAHEQGKACIIAVNKWDAVEKDDKTMDAMRKKLANDFSFMSYAPFIFLSAKTGQRVERLFELIKAVAQQNAMRISTGMLNDVLAQATTRVQPPTDKGRRLRIYYMTQASTKPPTFVFFVNRADLFHFSYQRYLENQIRDTFGLEGTPVRFIVREKGDNPKK